MNEKKITIQAEFDPDLAKLIQRSSKDYTDDHTGELIPKGSSYYQLPLRAGRTLVNAKVSVATYTRLIHE